jgi:hypothetical protein
MEADTLTHMYGVWGEDENNIFAVGTFGIILRCDGQRWSLMDSRTQTHFSGVWGTSANDVYAVGYGGIVQRFDGSEWSLWGEVGQYDHLDAVWGTSSDNLFVAGSGGIIHRFNGIEWVQMQVPDVPAIKDIWGLSGNDIYAAAELYSDHNGEGPILHYNGSEWITVFSDEFDLRGISCRADGVVYASGSNGALVTNENDCWGATGGIRDGYYDVWGTSADDVYALRLETGVRHYNGRCWEDALVADDHFFYDVIAFGPGEIYVVARDWSVNKMLLYHFDGVAWTYEDLGINTNLYTIWGSDPDDLYLAGSNGVVIYNPGWTWHEMETGVTEVIWNISGVAYNDVYATLETKDLLHFDGTEWKMVTTGSPERLHGIWGDSPSNVYAVGEEGVILRFDGTRWREFAGVTDASLHAVWGSSATDVYAAGASPQSGKGVVLHYDGTAWEELLVEQYYGLHDIWGPSSNDVFFVGSYGTVLHSGVE